MTRAVVLFSGGLDSMLALRILQQQGLEVEALNIRTIYTGCQATAARVAVAMGARLTVVGVDDDYLEVIRNPMYGYGKGVNPCIDCRIYMCRMAKRFMEEVGACVVASGEILGQRPMSQKRQHFEVIARRSGLEGLLLRPLSARLLPPTVAEREGVIDRDKLHDFSGRGRRALIKLAERLGISRPPSPSTGCALTEPSFGRRVRDLLRFQPAAGRWDFDLLNHGRHFRFDEQAKIIVGRNSADNAALESFASGEGAPGVVLLLPEGFRGPHVLVTGVASDSAMEFAGALMLRFSGRGAGDRGGVRLEQSGKVRQLEAKWDEAAGSVSPL